MNAMTTREFLKTACAGAAGVAAAGMMAGCDDKKSPLEKGVTIPQTHRMIKWRFQTYAGTALAQHVCKPAIDAFNKVAGNRMHIDLYYADQLVPTCACLAAISRLLRATRSMCLCFSRSTVSTRFGQSRTRKLPAEK